MKKLFFFFLLVISFEGFAQVKQKPVSYGVQYRRVQADSAMRVPTVTVGIKDAYAGLDTAQIRYDKTDSALKVYTGSQWRTVGSSTGTVTSVGLTMPSAFSVSGSPVTSSGTLAVTGAGTTSQYIRGDGSLATYTGGVMTASNGLTVGSNNVKLGGTLTENTAFAGGGFTWTHNNVSAYTINDGTRHRFEINSSESNLYSPGQDKSISLSNTYIRLTPLDNEALQDRLLGQVSGDGEVGYVTLGSGLSLSSGVLNTSGTVPTPISSLTASVATNSITVGHSQTWNYNGITSGIGHRFTSNSITFGSILDITGTSTALAAGNEGLNVNISGANATNGITATGARISVTNTNATSGTNVGLDITASGATTDNISINGVGRNIFSYSNTDVTNTAGAGSVLYLKNPSATGQTVVYSEINGSMAAKWRTDYVGNINWVAGSTGAHYFWVGGDYLVGNYYMYVKNNGKIGVGAAYDPTYQLDISGDLRSTTSAYFATSSGSVGIGTTSPASPLHVKGTGSSTGAWKGRIVAGGDNVAFLMGEYNSQAWLGAHNAALSAWADFYINPDGTQSVLVGNTGALGNPLFTVNNATAVVQTRGNTYLAATTGSVGIGTTSPSAKLHVISTTEQLRVGYDASNYYSTTVGSTGGVTFNAVGSGSAFTFSDIVNLTSAGLDRTITAAGTTGNQTINKMAGTVNIAAAGTTVTVTNSLVTTSSIIFCTLRTNDATATIKNVVPGSGSFVITLGAAATAEVSIGFLVTN